MFKGQISKLTFWKLVAFYLKRFFALTSSKKLKEYKPNCIVLCIWRSIILRSILRNIILNSDLPLSRKFDYIWLNKSCLKMKKMLFI